MSENRTIEKVKNDILELDKKRTELVRELKTLEISAMKKYEDENGLIPGYDVFVDGEYPLGCDRFRCVYVGIVDRYPHGKVSIDIKVTRDNFKEQTIEVFDITKIRRVER